MDGSQEFSSTLLFGVSIDIKSLSHIFLLLDKHHLYVTDIQTNHCVKDWALQLLITISNLTRSKLNELCLSLKDHDGFQFIEKRDPIVWYPKNAFELDFSNQKCLTMGAELSSDHPGAMDKDYKERRLKIADAARNYRFGEKIPDLDYTDVEVETWRQVFTKVKSLLPTHACNEYNKIFKELEDIQILTLDRIPQLQAVSEFLHSHTGWRLRPVAGLLSSRDFFAGLAYKVFHSTQYIRHHSKPFYTPEPDICHEILGHVPLLADPTFSEFSQEIGRVSLGVSDDAIQRLASCYWFTIEFGLCKQGNELRAYGSGILSSFGELAYCLTDVPKKLPFDPQVASATPYPITEYQPLYFVTESFDRSREQMIEFAKQI